MHSDLSTPPGARALGSCPGPFQALAGVFPVVVVLAACSGGEGSSGGGEAAGVESAPEPSAFVQSAFRIRSDTAVGLNADDGWAGPENESVTVAADRPFRIRFELEGPVGEPGGEPGAAPSDPPGTGIQFGLQVQRNGGPWEPVLARDFPYPDEISTPRVSIVSTRAWPPGEATADLLEASSAPFSPGQGMVLDSLTPAWMMRAPEPPEASEQGGGAVAVHGEWEWPVVIRRYADGAVTNDVGDTFTFRMVDGAGHPVEGAAPATVTLAIPPGLLGGTYVETPGVIGPWQAANGELYFPMEPAETFNVLLAMKSADGGQSWIEVDGANRPATDDLEGFATARHGGRIYMLHQISEATFLHAFNTSEVSEAPDRWVIRDELVARQSEPPVQVAALEARSDGSLVAIYGDSLGLRWRVRTPDGGWGDEGVLTTESGALASGVMATRGADDVVHLAYTVTSATERSVWYRTIRPDGSLTPPLLLDAGVALEEEDMGAIAPLAYLDGRNSVAVLYRLADGFLYERRVGQDRTLSPAVRVTDRQVVQCASDSDQVGADAVVHQGAVHVLFIDEETRDLFYVRRPSEGQWTAARPVVEGINAQWVRGQVVVGADGGPAYGFVYDAGSDGGSGMNWYGELAIGG
ncbi:MAG: exo-alpha-sialidase [Gemmatimonadota bacterium]